MARLHRQPICIVSALLVPFLTLGAPSWLAIDGVGPAWPVLWLLPWALVDGPVSGGIAGIAIGLVLSRLGVVVLAGALADRFHYDVAQLAPVAGEWFLVAAALAVGTLAAALPARSALRIDISNTLGQGR